MTSLKNAGGKYIQQLECDLEAPLNHEFVVSPKVKEKVGLAAHGAVCAKAPLIFAQPSSTNLVT